MHIVIDANIGAGKTTLINNLQSLYKDFVFWPENVGEWMSEGWLGLYYSDIGRYASSFQMRVLLSHLEMGLNNKEVNITERCAFSNVYIFSQMLLEEGKLSELEMKLHKKMLQVTDAKKPDLLIYLKTSPEVAYERLCSRSRDGEINITKEYLEKLGDVYDRNVNNVAKKVIVIDADRGEEDVLEDCKRIFEEIGNLKQLV